MKIVGLELKRLMNLIVRYFHNFADDYDLSMNHAAIIKYLVKNKDENVYTKDIEKIFNVRSSTTSRMLTLMEFNGLIERIDDKNDTRRKIIKPTKKAIEVVNSINNKLEEVEIKLKENIKKDELDIFFKVVEQMKQNIKVEDEG